MAGWDTTWRTTGEQTVLSRLSVTETPFRENQGRGMGRGLEGVRAGRDQGPGLGQRHTYSGPSPGLSPLAGAYPLGCWI